MNTKDYVLWLPSWYPNERKPYSGDFIQRHAKAAALNNKIKLIFFTQFGEKVNVDERTVEKRENNLEETIVYVPFKLSGYVLLDRLRYNVLFYKYSRRFLRIYFEKYGLPALVHVHVPVKSGNLAIWIKRKFGVPYIVSEQASTYLQTAPDFFLKRHLLYRSQVRKIFSGASAVTNVSYAVGKILQDLFGIKKIVVIPNVVDTTLFFPQRRSGKQFTYIHVSSLNNQKNIFGILRAFKCLAEERSDWKLVVIGPYTDELRQFIEYELALGLIQLTGEVSYAAVAKQMQQADVMVLFSRHENFPCVVVEALCCGLPVISSDVAGVSEAVNKSNGVLIESENENALLQAIRKVREDYYVYKPTSIADAANKKYSFPAVAKKFDALYREVLALTN